MKKVNLLSKAEMRKVIGGSETLCAKDCSYAQAEKEEPCAGGGICKFFAATSECPAGEQVCVTA